ncbi:hypothetical protein C1645_753974, partial [Glomus cerebriforme]
MIVTWDFDHVADLIFFNWPYDYVIFICISLNFVFSIGLFPFSFIFISNLYFYTLFIINFISLFLDPLIPSGSAIK